MVTIMVDDQFHLTSIAMSQDDTFQTVIRAIRERSVSGFLEPISISMSEFETRKARRETKPGMVNIIPFDPKSEIFRMVYKLEG